MVVRTISQLPRETTLLDGTLFEIAQPKQDDSSKFVSESIEFQTLRDTIGGDISAGIQETLQDGMDALSARVEKIEQGETELSGVVEFQNFPRTDRREYNPADYGSSLNVIPNMFMVRREIADGAGFVSTDGSVVADGDPTDEQGSIRFNRFSHGEKFYYWHIDDDGTDSSQAVRDDMSQTVDPYETIRDTGVLVVWGWLADKGDVQAYQAWVAMMACIKPEDAGQVEKYYPVSVQPWIVGRYSSKLQYVGFTVPVAAGTRIKFKTGFKVAHVNSAFQQAGTMTFLDVNIPNSFFGYVVKSNKEGF